MEPQPVTLAEYDQISAQTRLQLTHMHAHTQ